MDAETEQRLAELTARVEKLEAQARLRSKDSWKEIIGAAANDDLFEEAIKAGAEWRAQMNREGR